MEGSKVDWLDTITRDIESLAEWAKKRPDISDRVVSKADLKETLSAVWTWTTGFSLRLAVHIVLTIYSNLRNTI